MFVLHRSPSPGNYERVWAKFSGCLAQAQAWDSGAWFAFSTNSLSVAFKAFPAFVIQFLSFHSINCFLCRFDFDCGTTSIKWFNSFSLETTTVGDLGTNSFTTTTSSSDETRSTTPGWARRPRRPQPRRRVRRWRVSMRISAVCGTAGTGRTSALEVGGSSGLMRRVPGQLQPPQVISSLLQ